MAINIHAIRACMRHPKAMQHAWLPSHAGTTTMLVVNVKNSATMAAPKTRTILKPRRNVTPNAKHGTKNTKVMIIRMGIRHMNIITKNYF